MSNHIPQSQPIPSTDRKPGRSFTDPQVPLGEDVIARGEPVNGVADRARAVGVLRKAEELMASDNPSGCTPEGQRKALELACWRAGVTVDEYRSIYDREPEIQELERAIMDAACSDHPPRA